MLVRSTVMQFLSNSNISYKITIFGTKETIHYYDKEEKHNILPTEILVENNFLVWGLFFNLPLLYGLQHECY